MPHLEHPLRYEEQKLRPYYAAAGNGLLDDAFLAIETPEPDLWRYWVLRV